MSLPVSASSVCEAAARQFLARLDKPSRLLVAISGGSDSTGLLMALHRVADVRHQLFAVTIDHALRLEAAKEAAAVATLCARHDIAHLTLRWDGEKPQTGISAAARAARYRLLKQAAADFFADLVLTAHTADDQDETVAMRAVRSGGGTDTPGLAGMAEAVLYDGSVWIARPFLGLRRKTIRSALTDWGIGWIDDPSNADPHYERVRMRGALADGAVDLPDAVRAAQSRLERANAAAGWIGDHVTLHAGVLAQVASPGLLTDAGTLRFALSGLIAMLGGRENGPASQSMDRLLAMIGRGVPDRMTLGRVFVALRRDGLYLLRERRDLPELVIPAGGEGVWDGRFNLRNPLDVPVTVVGGGEAEAAALGGGFSGMPASLVARAAHVLPRIVAPDGDRAADVWPRIAPYDLFLPLFDLPFANALARLAGRQVFTDPALSL